MNPRLSKLLLAARPLPFVVLLAYAAQPSGENRAVTTERDPAKGLCLALQTRGLDAEPGEVFFVDTPRGGIPSRKVRALVRAHRGEDPADIYAVVAKLSPKGTLLELSGLYNLSDTSAVDERGLVVDRARAAWLISGGGRALQVKVADLRGEPAATQSGWTRLQRWQNGITNLQETGQRQGVGLRSFRLEPAAERVALAFDDTGLNADADGRQIRIPTDGDPKITGERYVQEQATEKARPGNLVTWGVDRVRGLPWFGSDRMQLVKTVAFAALDWIQRVQGSVTGDTGAERVKAELGELGDAPLAEFTDPETGWPPPPMEPMLSPPLEGEGKWRSLDKDPFILTNPGAPAPFVQSFIRTDAKRAYTQIWVTLWDPRQVSLHAMSGTIEPKSATGETGPGLVPRKPEVISRLVAGFNGGFQATHGEFGMMADGVVYLPPKPYGATVAELRDGSTAFGTWPHDEKVPDNIVSFRQNMTPLVQDETLNPYKRNWWGGVPPGWTDESRTTRSAVCMTKEGFAGYVYGASIDADHLMLALQRARCIYGIHLDMNPGHTGLEFYRVAQDGKLPDVGHKLDSNWEAEGAVSGMEGWRFLGRRMLKYMGLMNFPRYISRESRDFFYLTLRHVLPGENLATKIAPAEPGEGAWTVKGLPQHGFPYALATSWVRPDPARGETKVLLLKLDPRALRAARDGEPNPQLVVTLPKPVVATGRGLFIGERTFVMGESDKDGVRLASGSATPGPVTLAAAGIDPAGMLVYAEVATSRDAARDGALLDELLASLGCKEKLFLAEPLAVALAGDRDLSGRAAPQRQNTLALVRGEAPGAVRIFKDTPLVPVKEWYPLQAKRVRYFPKPEAAKTTPAGGEGQ